MGRDPVVVAELINEHTAYLIRSRLEAEGIRALLEHGRRVYLRSHYPHGGRVLLIEVPAEDAERAAEIIKQAESGAFALPGDPATPKMQANRKSLSTGYRVFACLMLLLAAYALAYRVASWF